MYKNTCTDLVSIVYAQELGNALSNITKDKIVMASFPKKRSNPLRWHTKLLFYEIASPFGLAMTDQESSTLLATISKKCYRIIEQAQLSP